MPKKGKRYGSARAAVPSGVKMAPDDAVKLVRELATAKFDESVDVATRLGVDPRQADQLVRGTVVLPHGTGKSVRVLAIVQGEKEEEAKEAGADHVGVEYVEKIEEGWVDFDVCVVTPDLMGKVGPLKLSPISGRVSDSSNTRFASRFLTTTYSAPDLRSDERSSVIALTLSPVKSVRYRTGARSIRSLSSSTNVSFVARSISPSKR